MSKFMNNATGLRTKGMMTRNTSPNIKKKVVKPKKPINPDLGLGGKEYNLGNIEL